MATSIEARADALPNVEKSAQLTGDALIEKNRAAFLTNNEVLAKEDFSGLEDGNGAWWTMGAHVIPQHIIEDVDENVLACMGLPFLFSISPGFRICIRIIP